MKFKVEIFDYRNRIESIIEIEAKGYAEAMKLANSYVNSLNKDNPKSLYGIYEINISML